MSTNRIIICQARMESQRFPGKVLEPLLGQPMLLWQLHRIRRFYSPESIVVATTNTQENRKILDLCRRHGYQSLMVGGDPNDVLHRYHAVAEYYDAQYIIRVTGDCPTFDGRVLFDLDHMGMSGEYDHIGIAPEWPDGQDCEWFTIDALRQAADEAVLASDREHVTPYIWKNKARFRCGTLPCEFDLRDVQWSVDTSVDLRRIELLIKRTLRHAGIDFTWRDLYATMLMYPRFAEEMQARQARNSAYLEQVSQEVGHTMATWDTLRYGDG